MIKPVKISNAAARRMALAAQGFDKPRPEKATRRHVEATIARLGVLQIDAVNVLARAHYLPLYSRLGAYDPALLDAVWLGKKRSTFEYWGHEASILPHSAHPLFRWRMEAARTGAPFRNGVGEAHAARWREYAKTQKKYLRSVLDEIRDRGPLGASELSAAGERKGPWWGWSDGKLATEYLFRIGDLTTGARRGFERIYDLPERVHPFHVHEAPTPSRDDAVRALTLNALAAMGVACVDDLVDYFRVPKPYVKAALETLAEDGAVLPADVEGWTAPAYLHPGAKTPRRIETAALLAPFDPVVWRRERALALFGFDYKIEIYVPQPQRRYGYYVLPFLLGDTLAARVDLKTDRANDALLVQAAHLEPGANRGATAEALARELDTMRAWLGLARVQVMKRGDLAGDLNSRPSL